MGHVALKQGIPPAHLSARPTNFSLPMRTLRVLLTVIVAAAGTAASETERYAGRWLVLVWLACAVLLMMEIMDEAREP